MEIIYDLENYREEKETYVTIGTFDGIHLGHQEIIKTLIEKSRVSHKKNILITFYPHPQMVVNSKYNSDIELLTSPEEKIEILKNFNIDKILFINFTKEFSEISPEEFLKNVLIEKLNATGVVVGYNHAFGKGRKGRIEFLKDFGKRNGMEITVVEPVIVNGKPISSTLIRKLLKSGDVLKASRYLGSRYFINGEVVKGAGRGKRLGFPTANLIVKNSRKLIPRNGVYIVKIVFKDEIYNGMFYIGTRSTYGETERTLEVNIFDFNKDIYGEMLKIIFLKRIRNDETFKSEHELYLQLKKDKRESIYFIKNMDKNK
ncbi:hypothetical protein DRQ09_07535 [candidate division KSB1 bacterium]|nr:MAG: hypothetical protein DRQ09_07535 [candidate division KSB1 bacterium]